MGVLFLNGFPEYLKQQGLQLLPIDRNSPVWPDGKKRARNVYAHSPEECEEKLAELIVQMKAEIAEAKAAAKQGKTVGKDSYNQVRKRGKEKESQKGSCTMNGVQTFKT